MEQVEDLTYVFGGGNASAMAAERVGDPHRAHLRPGNMEDVFLLLTGRGLLDLTAFALTPDISSGALRVWQRNRDATLRNWKTEFLGIAVEPFAIILALGLALGKFVELDSGEPYVEFLAPGLLALFPMFAATFECAWGSYVRLEMQGTYESIIATPISVDDVITGEILWGTTRAMVNGTYILIVASHPEPVAAHDRLALGHCWWYPWACCRACCSARSRSAFAAIARAMSHFAYFFNLVINPMFWFGGAFFPFDALPRWVEVVGWLVPLKHVVDIYRGLVQGNLEWSMLISLVWLAVVTALFYVLAVKLMRRRLIH